MAQLVIELKIVWLSVCVCVHSFLVYRVCRTECSKVITCEKDGVRTRSIHACTTCFIHWHRLPRIDIDSLEMGINVDGSHTLHSDGHCFIESEMEPGWGRINTYPDQVPQPITLHEVRIEMWNAIDQIAATQRAEQAFDAEHCKRLREGMQIFIARRIGRSGATQPDPNEGHSTHRENH